MDKTRMSLVEQSTALHNNAEMNAHRLLAARIMKKALTPEQTLARADALAAAVATAKAAEESAETDEARAEARIALNVAHGNRTKFRAWMRVQAAAEQGQRFKAPPHVRSVQRGEEAS